MLGLTTQRKKNRAVANVMLAALAVADATHTMLRRQRSDVLDKLRAGESVAIASGDNVIWPPNGARFSAAELWQMSLALGITFNPELYPARFSVAQQDDAFLCVTLHPASR